MFLQNNSWGISIRWLDDGYNAYTIDFDAFWSGESLCGLPGFLSRVGGSVGVSFGTLVSDEDLYRLAPSSYALRLFRLSMIDRYTSLEYVEISILY